jgi:hypothetical protein
VTSEDKTLTWLSLLIFLRGDVVDNDLSQ